MRTRSAAWLEAAARFRQGGYRLLAQTFRPPAADVIKIAPRSAFLLQEMLDEVPELAFQLEIREWLGELQDQEGIRLSQASARYESVFASGAAGGAVPLVQSAYRRQDASDPGNLLGNLLSIYAGAGFKLAASTGSEPDHISTQLEFASLLCRQESGAWGGDASRLIIRVLVREQLFLSQHLCAWLPQMARAVATRDKGMYAKAARAAWAMAVHDADFVRVSKAVARHPSRDRRRASLV